MLCCWHFQMSLHITVKWKNHIPKARVGQETVLLHLSWLNCPHLPWLSCSWGLPYFSHFPSDGGTMEVQSSHRCSCCAVADLTGQALRRQTCHANPTHWSLNGKLRMLASLFWKLWQQKAHTLFMYLLFFLSKSSLLRYEFCTTSTLKEYKLMNFDKYVYPWTQYHNWDPGLKQPKKSVFHHYRLVCSF